METECIGESMEILTIDFADNKQMPINPEYVDSIMSPKRKFQAREILERHNIDLLIHGRANQIQENCAGANICFRHIVADTIMMNILVPDTVTKINHGLDYVETSPFEIEQGKLSIDEKSFEIWLRSLIALKDNDIDSYYKEIEKIIGDLDGLSDDEISERYINQGKIFIEAKKFERAIISFNKSIEYNPVNSQSFLFLGNSYFDKKNFEKAILNYNEAIKVDSENYWAYHNCAVAFRIIKEDKNAIKLYNKILKKWPSKSSYITQERSRILNRFLLKSVTDRKAGQRIISLKSLINISKEDKDFLTSEKLLKSESIVIIMM